MVLSPRARRGKRGCRFMDRRAVQTSTGSTAPVTRAGYTGEDGFEISVRPGCRPNYRRLLADEGRAGRAGRARLAAAGGRFVSVRPRHRRDDDAGRGGADLVDLKSDGAKKAAFRAPRPSSGRLPTARPAAASAYCLMARAPAAKGRKLRRRRQFRRHGHQRRLRSVGRRPGRHGLCRHFMPRSKGTPVQFVVRGKPARPGRRNALRSKQVLQRQGD